MKARVLSGFLFIVLALVLIVGSSPVRGVQNNDPLALNSTNASPGADVPWTIETVDATAGVGLHVSVAIDPGSGITYISYYDDTNKNLKMAKYVGAGGNCGANSDWSCETVDGSNNDVGQYSSIAIDPTTNLPVIAYWDATLHSLMLATAWSGGWNIITIDENWGSYASLAIDAAGTSYISYLAAGGMGCEYACVKVARHVSGGTGNCGGNNYQCDIIDSGPQLGTHTSLALDDSGEPRITYHDESSAVLRYAQPSSSGNCGPGNSWACDTIATFSSMFQQSSLGVNNGASHIAYMDSGKVMVASWVGQNGNCGLLSTWQCDEIDTVGTATHTRDVSLAVDPAGYPIIAYNRYVLGDRFSFTAFNRARPAAALGLASGNCGPVDSWWCEKIPDSGHSGHYSSIAVDSSGLATIAYYRPEYYGALELPGTLKITYQRIELVHVFLPVVLRNQ